MTTAKLANDLVSGGPEQREAAAQTLATMGADAAPAAVALVTFAGDEAAGEWCVAALEELGPPAASDAARLSELASAPDESIAYWAATLLGRLGGDAATAVVVLEQIAQGSGPMQVRERAVWALGQIGAPAASARPTLESLCGCDQPRLSRLATQALEAIAD